MKSLLNALKDGRVVELPDGKKESCLEYLAHLIEAIPDVVGHASVADEVIAHEAEANTGIGSSVACPHVRVSGEGDLLCAVGWSPTGIDYGARDGRKVHLIFMYFIPDAAKAAYLKEISSVATAVKREQGIDAIVHAEDIAVVRERLLAWVSAAVEAGPPETKAKMIQLEARQAALQSSGAAGSNAIFPVIFVSQDEHSQIVLCGDARLAAQLESDKDIGSHLKQNAQFDRAGYRFLHQFTVLYDPRRPLFNYVAVKIG